MVPPSCLWIIVHKYHLVIVGKDKPRGVIIITGRNNLDSNYNLYLTPIFAIVLQSFLANSLAFALLLLPSASKIVLNFLDSELAQASLTIIIISRLVRFERKFPTFNNHSSSDMLVLAWLVVLEYLECTTHLV